MRQAASTPTTAGSTHASTASEPRLHGRWLRVARSAWLLLAVGLLANFVFGIQAYYGQLRTVCTRTSADCGGFWLPTPANVQALRHLGLSIEVYAAFFISFVVAVSLIYLAVGAVIFWRKSDEWLGLFTSLLLLFGCFGFTDQLQTTHFATLTLPTLIQDFIYLMGLVQYMALAVFFLTFPNGRIAPRWAWGVVPFWVVEPIVFDLPAPYGFPNWPTWLQGADILLVYGSLVVLQVYRYRRLYTPVQRQQTKWVVFGFALGFIIAALASFMGAVVPGLNSIQKS